MALCVFWASHFFQIQAAPQIRSFEPFAVTPGVKTVLTFSGPDLDSVSNLWTSFDAETERLANTNSGQVSFAVRCPVEARGIHALQLIGIEGASTFQLIMVDHLQPTAHKSEHRTFESALKIAPLTAVDCSLESEEIDYYRFVAKAGQNFSIEVIAHRIGSQMDPVVKILDASKRELAYCDDEGGVWKDARFRFTAPVDGDYTIAVHDTAYGGGANFDYRVRVSNDPLVWYTFPLVDSTDAAAAFQSFGEAVPTSAFGSPANPPATPQFLGVPQIAEVEPNDKLPHSQIFNSPVLLNGKLQSGVDVDMFQFNADKDERLIFRSQTRSLGSPCDLAIRIKKSDGTIIAQSVLGSAADAALTNKFSETGVYLLELRELSGVGVTNAPYRLTVSEFVPGFSAATEDNIIEIKPGASAKLKVTAVRYDYDGPIEFSLGPEVAGIMLEKKSISEKENEVELTLQANEAVPAGTFKHIHLQAHGTNGAPVKVSTRPALRKAFPLMLNPPPVLEGVVTLVAREK